MVPVVDLSRRGRRFSETFAVAARRIAESGSYLLGRELLEFEREFAAWLGATDAVGVSSGASALQLALTAAGIGPGDEVLVPAFTAVPTAAAVVAAGATPVAIDVDPETACLTPELVAAATTTRTRAAVIVHLYGYPAPVPPNSSDLVVIEDAAQAAGALHGPVTSSSAIYSFYPTKNLGGIADGGAVVTADPAIADRVRRLRAHGMTEQYLHVDISQNFRMSELAAAWLTLGLPTLEHDVATRRRIGARYRAAAPHLRWQRAHADHAHHLCVFRSSDRAGTRDRIASRGVATAIHYPFALTQQPAFRQLFTSSTCPEAESWAAECISVPCFAEMTDDEIDQVADALAVLPDDTVGQPRQSPPPGLDAADTG